MYTRKQYLDKECTHSNYYQQFITKQTKRLVLKTFGLKKIKNALKNGDKHLNSISLRQWDNLAPFFNCRKQLRACGDYETLAGQVCILKETARSLADEYNN